MTPFSQQGQAQNAKMQAMIMAAGLGTRMRPLTNDKPKSLVEVAGKKLMDYSLDLLRGSGISRTVINTHYFPEKLEDHLATQEDITINISHEPELLETGGGLMKVLDSLEDSFFVLNSDIICIESEPPALSRLRSFWDDATMDGILLLIPTESAIGYEGTGDFSLLPSGQLIPAQAGQKTYVFTGIQMLHKRFMQSAPNQEKFSLSLLYRAALEQQENCRLYGVVHQAAWYHVGDPQAREEAEALILSQHEASRVRAKSAEKEPSKVLA